MAEPMYLSGYIEQLGTGTAHIIQKSVESGLKEPEFIQEDDFKAIIYRPVNMKVDTEVTPQVTPQVEKLVKIINGEAERDFLQETLGLKDRENFRKLYLNEAIALGFLEMTIPDKPNSQNQSYRLTAKGLDFQKTLKDTK